MQPERDPTRGGTAVTFTEVLAQVMEWLQQDKRLSYRALTRQFALDHAYLDDLQAELIEVRRVAVEEDGWVLVWTADTDPEPVVEPPPQTPLAYRGDRISTPRRHLHAMEALWLSVLGGFSALPQTKRSND